MEYPIIDTLTNAYIRNGWTGLNLIYGKNLFNINNIHSSGVISGLQYTNDGETISYTGTADTNGWKVIYSFTLPVGKFYLSMDVTGDGGAWLSGYTSLSRNVAINNTDPNTIYRLALVSTTLGVEYSGTLTHIQIETGTERTPYEPYKPPITDIFSRTRLPIIRYFPHALIDSLQRASDGTMTSDDVQVLRHYLSRFGIGNIELGRFHAINPNMEENRTLEFEDFPVEEIKKKGG